jgi:hypothetical protein
MERWDVDPGLFITKTGNVREYMEPFAEGPFVLYDDAMRAVAEAEQRGRSEAANDIDTVAYLLGKRDERARIRAAVRRVYADRLPSEILAHRLHSEILERDVLDAIDAGGES